MGSVLPLKPAGTVTVGAAQSGHPTWKTWQTVLAIKMKDNRFKPFLPLLIWFLTLFTYNLCCHPGVEPCLCGLTLDPCCIPFKWITLPHPLYIRWLSSSSARMVRLLPYTRQYNSIPNTTFPLATISLPNPRPLLLA